MAGASDPERELILAEHPEWGGKLPSEGLAEIDAILAESDPCYNLIEEGRFSETRAGPCTRSGIFGRLKMQVPNFVKIAFLKQFLSNAASSNDTRTTILGAIAAALLAMQIDYSKLLNGDHVEEAKAAGAIVMAVFGYLTNKH